MPDRYIRYAKPARAGGKPKCSTARNPNMLYTDTNIPMPKKAVPYKQARRQSVRWRNMAETSFRGLIAFGVNRFWAGSSAHMIRLKTSAVAAPANMAQRQVVTSRAKAGMRRPRRPPMELPATYRPMARAASRESISSAIHVMATAGVPAMRQPWMKRMAMS